MFRVGARLPVFFHWRKKLTFRFPVLFWLILKFCLFLFWIVVKISLQVSRKCRDVVRHELWILEPEYLVDIPVAMWPEWGQIDVTAIQRYYSLRYSGKLILVPLKIFPKDLKLLIFSSHTDFCNYAINNSWPCKAIHFTLLCNSAQSPINWGN